MKSTFPFTEKSECSCEEEEEEEEEKEARSGRKGRSRAVEDRMEEKCNSISTETHWKSVKEEVEEEAVEAAVSMEVMCSTRGGSRERGKEASVCSIRSRDGLLSNSTFSCVLSFVSSACWRGVDKEADSMT